MVTGLDRISGGTSYEAEIFEIRMWKYSYLFSDSIIEAGSAIRALRKFCIQRMFSEFRSKVPDQGK